MPSPTLPSTPVHCLHAITEHLNRLEWNWILKTHSTEDGTRTFCFDAWSAGKRVIVQSDDLLSACMEMARQCAS